MVAKEKSGRDAPLSTAQCTPAMAAPQPPSRTVEWQRARAMPLSLARGVGVWEKGSWLKLANTGSCKHSSSRLPCTTKLYTAESPALVSPSPIMRRPGPLSADSHSTCTPFCTTTTRRRPRGTTPPGLTRTWRPPTRADDRPLDAPGPREEARRAEVADAALGLLGGCVLLRLGACRVLGAGLAALLIDDPMLIMPSGEREADAPDLDSMGSDCCWVFKDADDADLPSRPLLFFRSTAGPPPGSEPRLLPDRLSCVDSDPLDDARCTGSPLLLLGDLGLVPLLLLLLCCDEGAVLVLFLLVTPASREPSVALVEGGAASDREGAELEEGAAALSFEAPAPFGLPGGALRDCVGSLALSSVAVCG
mmetsp:Transcript_25789/g.63992  ORF Transcript_25789/g.63992 Transcript_25789/m.63992 type:complete len:364 (+) Transcript_25789:1674-2765(+)